MSFGLLNDQSLEDCPRRSREVLEWCNTGRQLVLLGYHWLHRHLRVERWRTDRGLPTIYLHNGRHSYRHNYCTGDRSTVCRSPFRHVANPFDMADIQPVRHSCSCDSLSYNRCCSKRQTPKLPTTLRVSSASSFTVVSGTGSPQNWVACDALRRTCALFLEIAN